VQKRLIGSGCGLGGEWSRSRGGCIIWGGGRRREMGNFGRECGASHCNQLGLCGVVILCHGVSTRLFRNYIGIFRFL